MSLTPAQEMLNVKLNCDGFMTDSESEEDEDVKKKPGVALAVEEQNEVDMEGATGENGKSVEKQLNDFFKKRLKAFRLKPNKKFIIQKTTTRHYVWTHKPLTPVDQNRPLQVSNET